MADAEEQIIQRLLTAINNDAEVSQRSLSHEIGIAVGSVNWYLKRCLSKGLIKLKHAPVRRYLYYLTPKGFEEKSRLTAAYLHRSFELYRVGRQECTDFVARCAARGKLQVYLAGDGDLAEIAYLSSLGSSVKVLAVIDCVSDRSNCAGVPIFASLSAAITAAGGAQPDAIMLTDLNRPRRTYTEIARQAEIIGLTPDDIYVPDVLNFRPQHG